MCLLMGGTVQWVAVLNNTLAHNMWSELHFESDHLCRQRLNCSDIYHPWWWNHPSAVNTLVNLRHNRMLSI